MGIFIFYFYYYYCYYITAPFTSGRRVRAQWSSSLRRDVSAGVDPEAALSPFSPFHRSLVDRKPAVFAGKSQSGPRTVETNKMVDSPTVFAPTKSVDRDICHIPYDQSFHARGRNELFFQPIISFGNLSTNIVLLLKKKKRQFRNITFNHTYQIHNVCIIHV